MTDGINTRELILSILLSVNRDGEYSHLAIGNILDKYRYLDRKDKSFIRMVAEGTIERKLTLDFIISRYSTIKVNKMKPVIREILRMSTYQMKFMDQIPDSAVCNEAVKLAGRKGFHNLKGFVNGVLRSMARDEEEIEYPDDSVRYSMPSWLCDAFQTWYGPQKAQKMMAASIGKRPLTIRCNLRKNTPDELKRLLMEEECTVEESGVLKEAFYLSGMPSLTGLACFQQGRFAVQDISSILAGIVAAPEKGSHIIDVCAAPGGKSIHLAGMMEDTGTVDARDLSDYKIGLIRENMERIGCTNMTLRVQDALVLRKEDIALADLVVADLPCSGLGVLARKSDLKYRIQPEDLDALVLLQRKILKVVSQYVKPGGILLYSTCTVNPAENIENVKFIEKELPFERVSVKEYLPKGFEQVEGEQGCIQLLQGIDPCDGFFIAKLQRRKGDL